METNMSKPECSTTIYFIPSILLGHSTFIHVHARGEGLHYCHVFETMCFQDACPFCASRLHRRVTEYFTNVWPLAQAMEAAPEVYSQLPAQLRGQVA